MQFQVPQFIEVEDKIFGPLTFKQFVFVGGGIGFSYLFWRVLPLYAAAPLIIGSLGLTLALAFMQYNGRPFIIALETGFYYLIHGKLYLWNNDEKRREIEPKHVTAAPAASVYVPQLSQSKLHELAWSLDIKERIAGGVAAEEERGLDSVLPIRTAKEAGMRFDR